MSEFELLAQMFEVEGIFFHTSRIYGESPDDIGYAIYTNKGHIEFDNKGKLTLVSPWA